MFERVSEKYPTIMAFSGDAGYRGTSVHFVEDKLKTEIEHFYENQGCLCRIADTLDCGTHFCLAGQFPAVVQGCRNPDGYCRKHHPHRYVTHYS